MNEEVCGLYRPPQRTATVPSSTPRCSARVALSVRTCDSIIRGCVESPHTFQTFTQATVSVAVTSISVSSPLSVRTRTVISEYGDSHGSSVQQAGGEAQVSEADRCLSEHASILSVWRKTSKMMSTCTRKSKGPSRAAAKRTRNKRLRKPRRTHPQRLRSSPNKRLQ